MTTVKIVILTLCAAAVFLLSSDLSAKTQAPSGGETTDAEYVSVSLESIPSTDGKALMLGAYGVILGLFLAYGASLVWRERSVARRAEALKRGLGSR